MQAHFISQGSSHVELAGSFASFGFVSPVRLAKVPASESYLSSLNIFDEAVQCQYLVPIFCRET